MFLFLRSRDSFGISKNQSLIHINIFRQTGLAARPMALRIDAILGWGVLEK